MAHEAVTSDRMFQNPAPMSPATRTRGGHLLHISGQAANDADGKTVGPGDIQAQTVQTIENIKMLVEAADGTLADVCRVVIYLLNRDYLPAVMEVRRQYFEPPYPATTVAIVSGLANPEWLVEIEATAALD